MRLIFSKDRPAQLDLLLRSLERFGQPELTRVIWAFSDNQFGAGYINLHLHTPPERNFNEDLRAALKTKHGLVTFFCDDDVVYRPLPLLSRTFATNPGLLTNSLRLGVGNDQMPLPSGFPWWRWPELPRHDFGFPASVDGHTFRISDVLKLIGDDVIEHPTHLETVMALRVEGMASTRPFMSAPFHQSLVGVPVNRVSTASGVPYGITYPHTTAELNRRWLDGKQIVLGEIVDPDEVHACHHEIEYRWEKRP